MRPAQPDVIDLETGSRVASLFPPAFGDDCGAVVSLDWIATATPERPATLRATLANRNEFRAKFRTGSLPPFGGVSYSRLGERDRASAASVYLAPTENHPLVDDPTDYERGSDGYWHAVERPPKQPSSLWLDPDESITGEYHLLCHPETDGFPPGQYRFGNHGDGFAISVWNATAPGPRTESAFEGVALPPLPHADTMAWYHDADATTEVYVEPSTERGALPCRIDFEFVNRSHEFVEGNPKEWYLYKHRDGDWYRIAPSITLQPFTRVFPGATRRETLRLFDGDPVPCADGHDVGHLGGGRYAFATGVDGDCTRAAAFDLLGDPVFVTSTDAITSVEREGDSLTATSDRGDPDDEYGRLAGYTLTRIADAESGEDARRLIAEQVLRRQPLRDALGLRREYGVRTVTIEEHDSTRPAFGVRESDRFVYDGAVYRVTTDAE